MELSAWRLELPHEVHGVPAAMDRRAGPPLYQQIVALIRNRLDRGELGALARIPSETELATQFGISRMTARKALDLLVAEGRVFRRQGKGTYVARALIAFPGTTQFSFSGAMNTLGLRHATRVLVAAVGPASPRIVRALRLPDNDPVVCIRRLRSVEGVPAVLSTTYLPRRFAAVLAHDLTGSLTAVMETEGLRVVRIHDSLQAITAGADAARLLEASNIALMRIEGIGEDSTGAPIRHTESLYRGDRFRFTNDIAGIRLELK